MTRAEQQQQRQEWEGRLVEYRASGGSTRAWCAANGVKLHQLRYRLGQEKASKGNESTSAVWLKAAVGGSSHDAGLLVRVGEAVIEVKAGFDPEMLSSVVRVLSAIC